jgi:AraC-like DNA-binding protein
VFRAQELSPALLNDPLQMLPLRDFCGLHEWAVRVAGDPGFGIELAKSFEIEQLGPLGIFFTSAPTFGAMIRRASRTLALYQSTGSITLNIDGEVARYAYSSTLGSLLGKRYVGMRAIFTMLSLARCFTGKSWLPDKIEVEYSKGSEGVPFESQFGVPVVYESDAFALTFPRSYLETPNPNSRPLQQQMTVRELANSLKTQPPRTISEATRAVLTIRLLDGNGDIEGTAGKLGLGPRTLQRRLREEGTNYRNMLSTVRFERAMSLLKESGEPIETIARSLGYAATSHFTRAFTQWTGTAPSRVRRQHRRVVS